jgi:hypothetical protein
MSKRPKPGDPEQYRVQLIELLENFEEHLKHSELREQVLQLVPAADLLQNLGSSLIRGDNGNSARSRILAYLRKYCGTVITGDELMIVAGISEYGRRIRELRVELGWRMFPA